MWSLIDKLKAADGAAQDLFGYNVAIDSGTIIVGAPWDNDNGAQSGSVYVFEQVENVWVQTDKITADDGSGFDRFGRGLAIEQDTIIIGAWGDDDHGLDSGSAYIFERFESEWVHVQKIHALDSVSGARFGLNLTLDGDLAAIGAWGADGGSAGSGTAYIFKRRVDGWKQVAKLIASDGIAGDRFGRDLCIDSGNVIVGARFNDDIGEDAGSAYVFEQVGGVVCWPDMNCDGEIDSRDILVFINAWANGEPVADWDNDGTITVQDVIVYVKDWLDGC